MSTKVTTLLVPNSMGKKISGFVINAGYGMKGKSRWICEAITSFLELDDYQHLATLNNEFSELSESRSFRVPQEIDDALKKAIVEIRKQFPDAEGVKSNIIRASILQRMVKQELFN